MTEEIPPLGKRGSPEAADEHTPKEWREKLRKLIGSEGEAELLGVGKMSERLRAHLAERSGELDGEAKEYGPKVAEFIASLPEKYNKLNWKTKLAVTGALMLGASLTATALPILSGALSAALYGQRVLGGIGLGINKRKALDAKIAANPEHWLAEKSELAKNTYVAALAAVYMGGTAFAVHEGVEALNELGVSEWLGNVLGHQSAPAVEEPGAPAPIMAETPPAEIATPTPEIVADTAPEAPVPPPEPALHAAEMPSIEASSGHGYEYMMKRLWEELPEDLDANAFPEGSDIRRLIEADADSIDKVVHQIAADPEHGFFNADGTSVQINLDSHMTVNADGDIQLGDMVKAPEGAPTTPAYHPETPVVSDAPPLPVEESVVTPDDSVLRDNEGNVVYDGEGNPVHTGTYETPPGTNEFGLAVPAGEPHIYADSGGAHLFVYGGSPAEQAVTVREYLAAHPNGIIYGADDAGAHRIPFYLLEGKVAAGLPVRTSGFLGFFSSWMKAPGPDEFAKIIK